MKEAVRRVPLQQHSRNSLTKGVTWMTNSVKYIQVSLMRRAVLRLKRRAEGFMFGHCDTSRHATALGHRPLLACNGLRLRQWGLHQGQRRPLPSWPLS